ncbi:MAG: hypothetical protein KDD63_03370, partial [Bacteroidetes bacterium]|nr:hypothetical protein [Bacteroidota bacterium]
MVATAATPADMDTSNDTLSQTLENVPLVALAFPWQETFESGPGIFTSGGANSTWELGTPAKDSIMGAASGAMAWVTNDSGFYNNNENSWVATACIDMTNAPANSWVSLKIWWESEAGWDGANLQSSVDGGSTWQLIGNFGDPNNWYNDNSIDGAPGGSLTGWAGRNGTGSGGYVLAAHPLPADLIGNPGVRLRVNFGSDGSVQDDGFAFDDFTISAPPAVDLGDSIVVCGTETLDAGYPGSTYVWSTGDVSQTITLVNTTAFNIIDSMIYVTVTDTFGLVGTDSVRVSIPATLPTVTASVTADVLCNGDSTGSALAVLNGGTAPITYLWSTNPAQNSEIASMLPAGTYTITVIDSFGCETQDSVTISEPPAIFGVIDSIADASCYGDSTGAIYLTIMGGVPGYTYAWSNGATTEDI